MNEDKYTFTDSRIKLVAEKAASEVVARYAKTESDLKEHLNYHKNKLNSDLESFRVHKKLQTEENKVIESKLTKVMHMFHDNAQELSHSVTKLTEILTKFNKLEEKVDCNKKDTQKDMKDAKKQMWTTIKWAAGIILTLGCTAYFSVNRSATDAKTMATKAETTISTVKEKVENINRVDIENQSSTEALFLLTISEVANKPVDSLLKKWQEYKKITEVKK
jgi:hypothetical protein